MTIRKIHYTKNFAKKAKKLPPQLKKQIDQREKIFRHNPFAPSLKTHKLTGRLKDLWAFSLTYSQRILFEFVDKDDVVFYDIGGHEIYR